MAALFANHLDMNFSILSTCFSTNSFEIPTDTEFTAATFTTFHGSEVAPLQYDITKILDLVIT